MVFNKVNKLFAVLALGALTPTATVLADSPNPGQVYIEGVNSVGGTGCLPGTYELDISEDGKVFTALFDEFTVSIEEGESRDRKFCQINLDMHVPQGWSYSLFEVSYAGYAYLDEGTYAEQKASYYFQGGGRRVNLKSKFYGEHDEDYLITDRVPLRGLVWSKCGVKRSLNLKTTIKVARERGASSFGVAEMTTDSIDGKVAHRFGIQWKRCRR